MKTPLEDLMALPCGYTLNGFKIKSLLGRGGFGIVYLAKSESLNTEVAIKEYLPSALATRVDDNRVVAQTSKLSGDFEAGRQRFIDEGRVLAKLHEERSRGGKAALQNILQVLQLFDANGTSYLVTLYYGPRSLKDEIDERNARAGEGAETNYSPPTAAVVETLFLKLINALELVHNEGLVHRDISPDNVLLPQPDEPVLIDFGGVRDFVNRHSRSFNITGKEQYMPIEQLDLEQQAELPLGPGSDFYALGATFYHLLVGRPAHWSGSRVMNDRVVPLVECNLKAYPPLLLATIDWCMRVDRADRPATAAAIRSVLSGTTRIPAAGQALLPVSLRRWPWLVVAGGVLFAVVGGVLWVTGHRVSPIEATAAPAQAREVAPQAEATTPEKPTLKILSNVDSAVIMLANIKPKYREGMEVELGKELEIVVRAKGYQPWEQTATMVAGENVVRAELSPIDVKWALAGNAMVVVRAGSYRMGDLSGDGEEDEKPVHMVSVRGYRLSKYEVTFEQYDRYCKSTGVRCLEDEGWGRGNRPVINVSWEDAQGYIRWLNGVTGGGYRLPSEAEWEYAARAGTSTEYSWGDEIGRGKANCDECGSQWDDKSTAPAGSFAANGWGLYDLHGNVWEWVEDCYHNSYTGAPSNGSAWTSGSCDYRVLRSGSWDWPHADLRVASRTYSNPSYWYGNSGFRLAQNL